MGTHSWSVPPLGLLALFSAATQVSPHFPNFLFSEFSGVSPHSARGLPPPLRVSWSIPPIRPHSVLRFFLEYPPTPPPSFFLFSKVFPHSARRQFFSCLEYPPTPPTVIFPVFWSIPRPESEQTFNWMQVAWAKTLLGWISTTVGSGGSRLLRLGRNPASLPSLREHKSGRFLTLCKTSEYNTLRRLVRTHAALRGPPLPLLNLL